MKTTKIISSSIIVVSALLLGSCKKIESPTTTSDSGGSARYSSGIFITNEGSFGSGNGSISYYNSSANTVKNSIFSFENKRPLGDVVQSITKVGDKAYICVNGSNKVEVVNAANFKEIATITNVSSPRYMVENGNTGYISSWSNGGEIALIDLSSDNVIMSIPVGSGPERMVINNTNLYVANSGGFGVDSTISVISTTTNNVITTIDLGAYNPSAIVNGTGNTIWVLARGRVIYDGNWNVIGHDPSKLIEINTTTNTITSSTTLFNAVHPGNLDLSPDRNTLYIGGAYGFTAIYTVSTGAPSTPTLFIPESNYGFFVNQNNGNLFILQEASSSNGVLLRYSPTGTKLSEHTVGVFPNGGTSRKK